MSSIVVAGDTSGSITIAAPAVAGSGTLTLPTGTDTLIGKATTDTLTNKTLTTPVINGASTGTGVATAATASTLVMRGAAGEITGAAGSFTTVSATGAITLQGNGSIMGTAGTSVSTSAVSITTARDYGTLSIVVGNTGGNIFSDLVYWGTTFGAVVMQSKAVSGSPAGRTYSVVSSILRVAMASGTYSVTTNSFSGQP